MNLQGAACVITGAAGGLGLSLAKALKVRRARLMLADVDEVKLADVAMELRAEHVRTDVAVRADIETLGRAAIEKLGSIDVWINNAGIWTPYVPAMETDFAAAHALMEVNYFGLSYGTLEALKHMVLRKNGAIVNILSVRALKGQAQDGAYCASKFAAEGFTQSVREEWRDSGIKIMGVFPARMKTGLFGDCKHDDYDACMDPGMVAEKIITNLEAGMAEHLEIWSASDVRA